jgi:hypothetical protein
MRISGYTEWEKWSRAKDGAISSRKQFSRYWQLLLVAWLCLYLLVSLRSYYEAHGGYTDKQILMLKIASTLFNNFNSWAIALCFIVFNHPTVFRTKARAAGAEGHLAKANAEAANRSDAEGAEDTSLVRLTRRVKVWGLVAVIVFAVVEYLIVFNPSLQLFPLMTSANAVWAADFISGIVGAITLALFVGRIQSKFLGPSTWLPLAFFFYVAIQSLYVAIGENRIWAAAMIEAALILKCLMYLYVGWLFKSGRLLFYFVRVKRVYESVLIEWQGFLAHLNRKQ